jgi:hypothetical protein
MENYMELLKEAQEQLTSRDLSVSIKDLTLCPRKKVFTVIDPVPIPEHELYDYISGQAGHDVIERLFRMYPARFRCEMSVQYKNIKGRIDVYDKFLNNILDIKESKSQKILLKPFKFHEEQVKYYMAMMDSEEGQIIYQMNNFGKYFPFPIYMNTKERKLQLEKLEIEANSLQNAIEAGDPLEARAIYDDNEIKWLCNRCPYLEKCNSIRGSENEKSRIETSARKKMVQLTDIELNRNEEPMKVDSLLSNHTGE